MIRLLLCIIFLLFVADNLLWGKTSSINSILGKKNNYKTIKFIKGRLATKKGDYVLASPFKDNQLNWAKNFDTAELGGVDNNHITYSLLKNKNIFGVKHHIGYDWMPAFYYYVSGRNRKFVDWLYSNKSRTTLNPNGPFLHCKKNGYDWCEDFYYDYGDKKLFEKRVKDLMLNMKTKGFNGVFFDWASGSFMLSKEYKGIKKTFEKRHPKKNYFKLVGKFYETLKKRGVFIVTNQAFRKEKYLLRYVAYDMTESYITTDIDKKSRIQLVGKGWVDSIKVTNYFPIYENSKSLKDSLHFIDLLTSFKQKYKKYGFKNFIYLNYIAPEYERVYASASLYRTRKPKNAIYFSYAMGKLTDNIVYAELSIDRKLERDNIYFYDLGKPLGKSYIKLDALKESYIRFYQNGFVLASNANKKSLFLKLTSNFIPKNKKIYDAYNDAWLQSKNNTLVIKLDYKKDSFSEKILPLGRVFVYNQN